MDDNSSRVNITLIRRNGVLIVLDPELPDERDVQKAIEISAINHENDKKYVFPGVTLLSGSFFLCFA